MKKNLNLATLLFIPLTNKGSYMNSRSLLIKADYAVTATSSSNVPAGPKNS